MARLCIDLVLSVLLHLNMSSHQTNKDKPRSAKCHHFCHPFDSHNYCPTCREAGKGDDPCVTFISPCTICASFTEEQQTKITHRKRYTKRDKKSDKKNDEAADILGDNSVESFGGSQAELEVAAERLFSSPPRPQPLAFEALKTSACTVPPTPDTILQQKLETKLEKSLGSRIDIQIDQKMDSFQANMLEAMKALREDFQKSLQKSKEVEVDQTTASASKPGPSNKNLDPPSTNSNIVEAMEVEYGPDLPPRLDVQDSHFDDASGVHSSAVEEPSRLPSTLPKKSCHSHKHHSVAPSSASDHSTLSFPKTLDLP